MTAVLVTGIAGSLARLVAERLVAQGHRVVGVDRGGAPSPADGVEIHRAGYYTTAIDDLFRRNGFDSVLHLGGLGDVRQPIEARFDPNVLGSRKLMSLCHRYGVKRLVVLSTFEVYGAHPRNPTPISEDGLLRAGARRPQLADTIQLDNMTCTLVYQHRDVRTVLLRPTNILGPKVEDTVSQVLRLPWVPRALGFDPMMQFIDERDMADAIVRAHEKDACGVFNVAGPELLPWKQALALAGVRTRALPSSMAERVLRKLSPFPEHIVDFLRYPCVIADARFRQTFEWAPKADICETLRSTACSRSGSAAA